MKIAHTPGTCHLSPSSLLLSLPCFPWWRILLFCYFVSALHPPPALLASLKYAYSPCVLSSFILALLMLTYLRFVSSLPSLFDFDLDIVCFHPVFFLWVLCCLLGFGFCCDSLKPTGMIYDIWYIYIDVRSSHFLFLSEVYDLFQLFERSEFLIDTPHKKNLRVCPRARVK